MKVEKAIGLLNMGYVLVTKMVEAKQVPGGGVDPAYLGGELVSPHEVPDSTDPMYHRLPEHGGGPTQARKTKVTIPVPPSIVAGLVGSSILLSDENGYKSYVAAGVAANKKAA